MQDFREPLYLKDKAVRVEDTRTDDERKYPQLFRQKLEGASLRIAAASMGMNLRLARLRLAACTPSPPPSSFKDQLDCQSLLALLAAGEGWKVEKSLSTVPIPGYNI